jgi:hypothetical protein
MTIRTTSPSHSIDHDQPARRSASPRSLHKATSSSATAACRSAGGSSAASATAAAQHSPAQPHHSPDVATAPAVLCALWQLLEPRPPGHADDSAVTFRGCGAGLPWPMPLTGAFSVSMADNDCRRGSWLQAPQSAQASSPADDGGDSR